MTLPFVRAMIDGIQVFKNNKEKSMAVMKRYLRGASDEMLDETYNYFASPMPRLPYPCVEAVRTALDMMSDQFSQANSVDLNEVVDLSFVKRAETGGARK
jgi:hypothetical protein